MGTNDDRFNLESWVNQLNEDIFAVASDIHRQSNQRLLDAVSEISGSDPEASRKAIVAINKNEFEFMKSSQKFARVVNQAIKDLPRSILD